MQEENRSAQLAELIDLCCNPRFAEKNDELKKAYEIALKIYSNEYRHSYSDIFIKLQDIFSNDSDDGETLEVLGENLNCLIEYANEQDFGNKENQEAFNGLKKLVDHVNLEIGRYNFIRKYFWDNIQRNEQAGGDRALQPQEVRRMINNAEEKIEKLNEDFKKISHTALSAKSELDKGIEIIEKERSTIDERLESNKISSITALTIFSAVILAFSGGITFEAGILKGLSDVSPFRLVFVAALTGFILFNTVFVLLYIVGKIVGKQVGSKCKYCVKMDKADNSMMDRVCGEGTCRKPFTGVTLFCKAWNKYAYALIVDAILLGCIFETFVLWLHKQNLLNYNQLIVFGIIVPICIALFGAMKKSIRRIIQKQRIILRWKIKEINDYYDTSASNKVRKTLMDTIGRLVKDDEGKDQKIKKILKENKQKAGINKITVLITDDIPQSFFYQTITFGEHIANMNEWNRLKKKLRDDMEKLNPELNKDQNETV